MCARSIVTVIIAIFIVSGCDTNTLQRGVGTRLFLAQHIEEDGDTWMEYFRYDSRNRLIRIEDHRSLGRRIEIRYLDNRISEFSTFRMDTNEMIFRDSIVYNENGQVEKILKYSVNAGASLPLSQVLEYKHDLSGKLVRKTYSRPGELPDRAQNYYWNGTSIERVEHIYEDELRYEYFYTYDNKNNYRLGDPRYLSDPIFWGRHNVTTVHWNDYYGNLDLLCRPCTTAYRYNANDMPVMVTTNWGRSTNLIYSGG